IASLDLSTGNVSDLYHLSRGVIRGYYSSGILARDRPLADSPDEFEWEAYDPRGLLYSMLGLPHGRYGSTSVTGTLGPCQNPIEEITCADWFPFLGEPLGAVVGLSYHAQGFVAADDDHHVIRLLDATMAPGSLVVSILAGAYGGKVADGALDEARFDAPGA